MHENTTAERDWDQLKKIGYEHEDIELGGIAKSMIGLSIFTVGSILLAAVFFWYLNRDAFAAPNPSAAFARSVPKDPAPLLQTNITTKTDIQGLRQHERSVLESYGQVDDGHIRVPIDRAMDLALEKGLIKGQPTGVVTGK